MADKRLPFTRDTIEEVAKTYPTPFHIYDEKAIRENARALKQAFSWAEGFREFFAVKALPQSAHPLHPQGRRFRRGLQLSCPS